ncbi:ECF transporter S component [Diplocloster modestus]|uniref:Riboflavin transporter n=1 Tax=Diplocloster modestus TaxID=2850322 RepID=A0ABS6K9E0_9FIRM|nr:ECF transporter S component [Diplocloster modestus]MBU9727125.1 ECF transporter S component [Diplocloster modestus]
MNARTKKLTTVAMLCAIAYLVMVIGRIPVVLFLKYDPKDVIITMGGFMFGPIASLAISVIVSLVEMFTVSDTGIIGCIMNILSSCSFACTAAVIYKKKHTVGGAVGGLAVGLVLMTGIMLLWNYFVTPIYMGYPREAVAELLIPAFLPFNLLKGGLNAAITMLIYKPLVTALRKARLIPESTGHSSKQSGKIGIVLVSGLVLVSCILLVLVMKGVL